MENKRRSNWVKAAKEYVSMFGTTCKDDVPLIDLFHSRLQDNAKNSVPRALHPEDIS